MSAVRDGFLSRWSRLKRDGAVTPPRETGPRETAPAAPQPPASDLPEGRSLEELIAELPRIEDLVPGQSLTMFMQSWVPGAIRNAALQRMWLLDPAVRDYVDPALDYAYDYNTPGAAPGFGPMETSDEMVREVSEMFDRAIGPQSEDQQDAPPLESGDIVPQSEDADDEDGRIKQMQVAYATQQPALVDKAVDPASAGSIEPATVSPSSSEGNALAPRSGPRRHGRALPI